MRRRTFARGGQTGGSAVFSGRAGNATGDARRSLRGVVGSIKFSKSTDVASAEGFGIRAGRRLRRSPLNAESLVSQILPHWTGDAVRI